MLRERFSPMKSTFLAFCSAFGILLLATSLCPSAHASPITVTITGTTGSGRLLTFEGETQVETLFTDSAFVWTLTYDSTSFYTDPNIDAWGANHAIFFVTSSVLTVEGIAAPINVTQDHGLWVYDTSNLPGPHLWMGPVFLSSGIAAGNILGIEGTIPTSPTWNGKTTPYQWSGTFRPDFRRFVDLATDQGLLSFGAQPLDENGAPLLDSNGDPLVPPGTITSVTASAGTTYTSWVAGISWNGGDSTATADPDHDGLTNLMEYALGGNPVSALSAIKPQPQVSGQKLQISFPRTRSELTYTVQGSSDLVAWTDIAYTPVAQGSTQVVTDTVTLTGNAKRFLRLRVTLP